MLDNGEAMGLREELQKRVDRKLEEIRELELQAREAQAYLQSLQDTLKMLPRALSANSQPPTAVLRPGSDLAKAYEAIKQAGKPLHISVLLEQLGKPLNRATRAGLSGNLAAYVRRGEIFTRPAPNTFYLAELDAFVPEHGPPEDFGNLPAEDSAEPHASDDDEPF